jgi:hypothetical protein
MCESTWGWFFSLGVKMAVTIPIIASVIGVGTGIYDATKKPNTPTPAPVTTIPGSPTSIISTGGTPGAQGAGGSPFLDQLLTGNGPTGTAPTRASAGPPNLTGLTSGGSGPKSAVPPAGIAGGGGVLPWLKGIGGGIQPGTPGAL